MIKKITILLVLAVFGWVSSSVFAENNTETSNDSEAAIEKQEFKPNILRDGFALFAVDGKVVFDKKSKEYSFIPEQDVTDGKGIIRANDQILLLKCNGLERVVKLFTKEKKSVGLRLWGRIATSEKKSYLYINYFLPLGQIDEIQTVDDGDGKEIDSKPAKPEAAQKVIPKDVLEKLRPKKFVDVKQLKGSMLRGQDVVIVDRAGFISKCKDGPYVFCFDAIGRNVSGISFELLPCEELDDVGKKIRKGAFKSRYQIAGIATQYKGKNYMLPQRARKVYDYGNFAQ